MSMPFFGTATLMMPGPEITCPYLRDLYIAMEMSFSDDALTQAESLFKRLQLLEKRAEENGAPKETLATIAAARKAAGFAAQKPRPQSIR
ncbi:hypothetical protein [Methylobacterium nonmethylotrophicum]|uniref:Uncharacterized protein n=1 Tax=Methylobacterium nonmethylotrophicum TaxID=1141884 RepID=A0A4Z0NNL4_9HYPH|nr:hypothetical protein [Methylobacterium nonmethylotrophicum]TGD98082.1 hypothetical protein EU555_18215 [Methylobacterium nonmethylotrophicum]